MSEILSSTADDCEKVTINDALKKLKSDIKVSDYSCRLIEYPWDKNIGTIFHYNQFHNVSGLSLEQQETTNRVIASNQVAILKQLFVQKPKPNLIVEESRSLRFLAGQSITDLESLKDFITQYWWIQKVFPDLTKDNVLSYDFSWSIWDLWLLWAWKVYAILTDTPFTYDYNIKIHQHSGFREPATVITIRDYLEDNIWDTVALIYGSWHSFADEMVCNKGCPKFYEYVFWEGENIRDDYMERPRSYIGAYPSELLDYDWDSDMASKIWKD